MLLNNLIYFFVILIPLFFVCIRYIIINECNPKVTSPVMQHCFNCAVGGVTFFIGGGLFHFTSVTPGVRPLPLPGVTAYQRSQLGFSYKTSEEGVFASAHIYFFGELPPTIGPDKAVDTDACRAKLAGKVNSKLPFFYQPFGKFKG